ncbi:hypothetical protein [Nocardia arthritidis]|uniref:Uncharacterized protein n=1 Tax=Nocardia arthritidis TaxID=228602 RepID=A0A6G9YG16_9NOCA|nr:hypothetical protein [Nocardia arthritidis]QIS12235.1 hypothetical protein F5544_21865 [Nocardia arthritidis]
MVTSREIPFVHGMDFTVGVDSASGSARNAAATGTPSTVPNAGGSTISFHMEQVETVEDLLNSVGVSAKASGGIGLFSASARFDFAQSCKVHSSSVFLIVAVQVTEAFQSVLSPGIKPEAAALLANGDTDRFREEFGDLFVRGILSGGQFFGVVEVATRDQTDAKKIAAGLSASYAAFSASGTFDKTFTDTVSSHRTKVTCFVEGGQNLELPTGVDTMTKRAVGFPKELEGHAVPYLALLDDYGVLPLPKGPNFADLQHQQDVLTECARLRNLHQQWLNDLDYIDGNPGEFIDPDPAALDQLRNDIDADMNAIAAAASQAIDTPKNAQFPTNLKVTAPRLPQRIQSTGPVTGGLGIFAGPNSTALFPRILRDIPDHCQITTTLTVHYPEPAISAQRHAGIAILTPSLNRYKAISKCIDATGKHVVQLLGTLDGTAPTVDFPKPFDADTIHLQMVVHGTGSVLLRFSTDGVTFQPIIKIIGKANAPHPPIELALFAFSGDDVAFTATFTEPEIVQLPPPSA